MAEETSSSPKQGNESAVLIEMAMAGSSDGVNKGLHFRDGIRAIHYVIVYERCETDENENEEAMTKATEMQKKRDDYEKELVSKGLEVERERITCPGNKERTRHFVKVHLPLSVLLSKAEELKLKAPLEKNEIKAGLVKVIGEGRLEKLESCNPLEIRDSTIKKEDKYFMAPFHRELIHKYSKKKDKLFSASDYRYVTQLMCFEAGEGLRHLIYEGVYIANYSLHDGDDSLEDGESPTNDRQRLKKEWARFGRCFKYQPYDLIKSYFGTEVALYFAWLGFYTSMLVPLALAGLVVFIYGIVSATTSPVVRDSCDDDLKGYFYMCPLCDRQCSYWDLVSTTCAYAYVTHFFDNDATVFLAIFSSIWATLFLEFWKRRQVSLAIEWNVKGFEKDEEPLRPEFAKTAPSLKENPVNGKMEPYIPKRTRYQRYGAAGSIIALMILLVIAAVVGVVIYRAAVFAALSGNKIIHIRQRARIVTSITAAIINLICINLLKFVYHKIAVWLTNWENPRTRTDYEDSFTYKMYLFQFVNTYASIFYIAFFKSGLVVGTPGRYKRIAGNYRLDGCSEQGCFLELCVQLFIIMVGQQIIGNITEIAIPFVMEWLKRRKAPANKELPQYEQDFDLNSLGDHNMFWEYLEVVLQYGFVTMFVAAFPLGPVFALLNSIVEIRVDAINFVAQFRRPDIAVAEDIGAWYRILEGLTKLSVLVNAFVLSFTSDFIPRLLYRMKYAPDRDSEGSLNGYLNASLSFFEVKYFDEWEPGTKPEDVYQNLNYSRTVCRYRGFHDNAYPFKFSKQYWHMIAARLAFVFVFQYTVYAVTNFIAFVIADKSRSSEIKERMETLLVKDRLFGKGKLTDNFRENTML